MDWGPHTGARLGTIGISNSFDFYIPITPYPLRGKGGSKGNFWPSWRVRDSYWLDRPGFDTQPGRFKIDLVGEP